MNTYKEMLIQSGHYTLEQVATWTEADCEAEYQEITIGGE
jgi:predicted flap endonuclease-1-like 5' DNA nuclease